jgi:hypothetical protein
MARLTSLIKFKGKLDGLSAYKTSDGDIIRRAGGGSADQFYNSPTMELTRQNASEFGRAASASKALREAVRSLIQNAKDSKLAARLTQQFSAIIKVDDTNPRGERGVLDAETEALEGFEFNINAKFSGIVFAPISATINRSSGSNTVAVPAMVPTNDLVAPAGATHFKIVATAAVVDFATGTATSANDETAFLAYGVTGTASDTLAVSLPANSTGPIFVGVGVEFYQDVNGTKYPLKNGSYNAAKIVKVDGGV